MFFADLENSLTFFSYRIHLFGIIHIDFCFILLFVRVMGHRNIDVTISVWTVFTFFIKIDCNQKCAECRLRIQHALYLYFLQLVNFPQVVLKLFWSMYYRLYTYDYIFSFLNPVKIGVSRYIVSNYRGSPNNTVSIITFPGVSVKPCNKCW